MKVKTFILTFLMMMSSPFLFGQSHWTDPDLGTDNAMPLSATITLDDILQTEAYQVAAFHGETLLDVVSIIKFEIPNGGGNLYHVDMDIPRIDGKTNDIYFRLFNGTNEFVSSTKIDWNENGYLHTNPLKIYFTSVAQIEGTEYDVVYSSLQDAIDAAANDNVVTLLKDNAENVTVVQAPNVAFTIEGAGKTMSGTITVNGKSAAYPTAGLTIKNVNFNTTNIADASIMLGVSGDDNTRYTNGVTVQDCDFTGNGQTKVAIKNYTGGCKNITVSGGTFTGLHSLMQVKGVDGVEVSGVTVKNCKNGIAVGTSTNVAISGSIISATGYGVRADGDGAYTMTLTDNTISAELPVVVRKATGNYNLNIEGDNNSYTASNENAYQVVFTTGDDGTYEAPTGQFVLTAPENFNVYPVYVAQVGDNKYTSVVTAINEAADGATVQLLPGTIDEYVYPWPESNHSKEKSITIVGAENFGTTLTGGMYLGYDDSQCREHNIVVKGINFTGKGLKVACQQNVTIEGNKFDNITEGQAIAVVGKNINSVVKNNVIDGVETSNPGIELRNTLTATVEGNTISNTGHNALQITSQLDENNKPIDNSSISVSNNTMSNWGLADNANGEKEGRAMRINNIVTATISGNVMSHTAAPEEFVKVTGATTLDVSANYWNGISPLTEGMFAGVEGDLVRVLVSYYTDAEKTKLVTLAPSVAEVNGTYYQSLETALKAATENCTINILTDITIDYKWDCRNTGAKITVPVTINGNDKTINFTGEVNDMNWNTLFRFENNATVKNLTLDASAATGIQRGISAKLNVTVENCTLIGNGTTAQRAVIVGEGAGASIGDVTATITGSIFKNWIYGVSDNQNAQDMKEIVITGCTFDNANVLISAKENVTFTGNNMSENSYVNISSYTAPNEVVVVATDNTNLAANTDTKYNQINAKLENITAQEGFLTPVATINGKNYFDLQKAIDAATEGQTVTVIANVELEKTVTVAAGKVVTLDLNGNVVSGVCNSSQAHLFMVQNTAELTVKDSSENQEGKITYARGTSGTGWTIDLEGELVLESGTIELTGESWSIGYVVDIRPNSWGTEYTEATTFTMNGGKLVSSFDAIRIASSSADGSQAGGVVHENVSANFVMNDGEIVSNRDAIFVQQSNAVYDILNLQVNDGKISGTQSLIRLYGPAATSVVNNVENPITLDLNGGTFDYTGNNLEDTRWLVPGVIMVAGSATFDQMLDYTNFEITGGTFDGDVSAYCAFGYTCQANVDGTYGVVETEGFEIPNLDRLIAFRNAVNAGNTFKGQTVTVTAYIIDLDGINWTPIGTEATPFMGTFDGGNFTISNLKINAPETSNVGLFGCIKSGAIIKNLTIDNATVNAKSNVGAIVGNLHTSTMDNCHVTGLVQINGNYKVGGLVGTAYSSVRNSSLVADDYSYVEGTYATANLEGDNVGGITGYNGEGVYTYSNNTVKNVTISGTRKVGGILGFIFEDAKVEGSVVENVTIESTATNEYAQENAGKMSIGGIIGQYQTHDSNNGYVNSSVVKNVTFVKGEELDFQVGPLVGGTRNNPDFVPSATVTSAGNAVYMTTITGSNNLFLMHAVAKIEETNYYTLEEAIAAANNQTVTVLEDVELRNSLTINVDQTVTLDLNGHVISGVSNAAASSSVITNNGNLTVQSSVEGGKITSLAGNPDQNDVPAYANNTITNRGTLTLVSGTIENSTEQGLACFPIDNNSTSRDAIVNIEGGLVTGRGAIRQFANSETNKNEVNVTGGKVEGTSYAIWVQNPSDGSGNQNTKDTKAALNISAGELGKILLEASAEFEIAISGGTISEVTFWETDETNPERNASAFITGGTFNQAPTAYVAEGYVVKQNADGTYGVFLGVAKIDETGAIYGTLAEAISNATAGNTITLLANVTENVTVNKSLTINGNDNEYTGNIAVEGSTVNAIVKNVKFVDYSGYAITTNRISSITVENCTVNNYGYGFLYANKTSPTVNVKDVTVDGCNYGFHWVYGTTATLENVTMTNVTYGLYIQNYASKTINVKNSNISSISIWERSGYSGVQTFNFEGESTVGTFSASQYAKYVLTSADATLVNAPAGLTVETTVEGCVVEYEEGETEGFGTYSVVAANVALYRGEDLVKKFATIQAAIDAAVDGDVVKVLKDLTVDVNNENISTFPAPIDYPNIHACFVVAGKTITIDFAGCDITANVTATSQFFGLFFAGNNGHLTLTDSSEEVGTVEMIVSDNAKVYALITNIDVTSSITVENGNYSCNQIVGWGQSLIYDAQGKMLVEGGNYYLGNIGTGNNGLPWIFNTYQQNQKSTTVTGGTFNADVNHQYWAHEVYVPETLALKNNGNGTWIVVESEAYITEISSGYTREVGYATLAEAFEATIIRNTEDNTVTVVKNITLAESITVNADQEVVLDLNGKNIDVANDQVNFNINGKLTLKDAVGTGVFTSRNHMVNAGGEFIINAGTVQNIETLNVAFPIYINGGSVTINGGTIQAVNNDNYAIGYSDNGGTLTINGGTVKGNWGAVNMASGSATITAGTLEVTGTKGGHALYVAGDAQVTIEGGEFKPYVGGGVASYALFLDSENATVNVSGGMFHKEWQLGCVDVIAGTLSLTGGTFEQDVNEWCAEGYAAVDNGNDTWTVMPTQEQHLVAGWNWYSSYLDITSNDLTTALGSNATQIKGQENNNSMEYNSDWGIWSGNITLDFAKMYMINTTQACDIKLADNTLNPEDHPVKLIPEWNWIGYPSNVSVSVNVALKNLEPNEGDVIKTRNSGHAEYAWGTWVGKLQMIPGEGYMYRNTTGEEKSFVYNIEATEATRGTVEANITAENNYWTPNVAKYPFNMTMTAVVEGMTDGNYEVAAFVNGEVRGSARPIYVEQMDAYVLFLTICGDEVEEMSFRLYDIDNDTEYDLSDRINYSNNAHLGSAKEPYVFSRGTTGIGEAALSNLNIYPNPTTIGTEINLQATCDKVEVFNAIGVKVAEYQNVDTIDALEVAGVYVIRVTNNGNVQNCRLVVK